MELNGHALDDSNSIIFARWLVIASEKGHYDVIMALNGAGAEVS